MSQKDFAQSDVASVRISFLEDPAYATRRIPRSSYIPHLSSILFGGFMVPNIESDYILLLGYSILYKEYNLTGFSHQKNATTFGQIPYLTWFAAKGCHCSINS